MRMQRMILACIFFVAASGFAWAQEYRGTLAQQMACTPDVWRLCSDQVPDVDRIVACLRQNTPQLSNGCRAVFESNAAAQPSDTARAVPQPPAPRPLAAPSARPQAVQPSPPRSPYDED